MNERGPDRNASSSEQIQARPSSIWLITFTDLVALMLTFFVMLFSMSSVKIDRWNEMTDALSKALNPTRETTAAVPTAQYNISTVFRRRAINLDYLTAVLKERVENDPLLAAGLLTRLDDRLVLSLSGDRIFPAESAELNEGAKQALFNLGGVLRHLNNQISVDGYMDPAGAGGGAYASIWELSLARAVAVANAFRRAGYPEDIVSYGYADSRFARLAGVATAERRGDLARRIDIIILSTSGTK